MNAAATRIFSIERHEHGPDDKPNRLVLESGWAASAETNAYQRMLALALAELEGLQHLTNVKHRHEVNLTLEFRNIELTESCLAQPACAPRTVNFWLNDGKRR